MRRYEVDFVATTETRLPTIVKDQFEFRKDKKCHLLQKALFWVLVKLGCYVRGEEVSFKRHTIDPTNFMENLFAQDKELVDIYHMEGKTLLIGPKEYSEMTDNPEVRQIFEFPTEYHYNGRVMGMSIKVIPWMKGMLVVP